MTLQGKSVAILIAPRGTEEPEFSKPKQAIEEAGGKVTVVSFDRARLTRSITISTRAAAILSTEHFPMSEPTISTD